MESGGGVSMHKADDEEEAVPRRSEQYTDSDVPADDQRSAVSTEEPLSRGVSVDNPDVPPTAAEEAAQS